MLTVEYAKDPFWNSADGEQICLTVKFEEFQGEIPFTATSFDTMPYGVDLYNRARAGEFGVVGAYVPVPVPTEPQPTTTGAQTL